MLDIQVKLSHPNAKLPTKTDGNIGWDLSCVADESFTDKDFTIGNSIITPYFLLYPGERHLFHTGLNIAIPDGYAGLLWDRSGLAAKFGVHRLAGVIDSSYRGEWLVCLVNTGNQIVKIQEGDRIAQVVIQEEVVAKMRIVGELNDTDRGSSGFGSSGR